MKTRFGPYRQVIGGKGAEERRTEERGMGEEEEGGGKCETPLKRTSNVESYS